MASSRRLDEEDACVTFFWNINNYSYCWDEDVIDSPNFTVESKQKIIWNLIIHPRGDADGGFISYYLCGSLVHGSEDIEIEYDIAILAEDGSVLTISKKESIHMEAELSRGSELTVLKKDVTRIKREVFLSGGTLRFRCRLWWVDGKAVTPLTLFARTAVKVEKRNFFWNIALFTFLGSKKNTYVIKSESNDKFMTCKIEEKEGNKLTICIKSFDEDKLFVKFQSFIIDRNGSRIDCEKREMTIEENEKKVLSTLPFTKKYIMDNKEMYLKNGVLTLYCECAWSDDVDINRIERIDYGITLPYIAYQPIPKPCMPNAFVEQMNKMADLKEDFESLYSKSIFCDVILRTTTQTFNAHKNILSARSPVFGAMFTTDMKEKIQESVDVSDLEDDTVRRMLLYMYTNALEDLQWESALKLYAAADKYEIVALKSKCSLFLKCNLLSNNVCDALLLADMHKDDDLKKVVQEFALAHEHDVFHSEEWIVFTKAHPVLASETMLLKWNNL